MKSPTNPAVPHLRISVTVRGMVQGVGFRPFVYNSARAEDLSGFVRNEADRVHIEVEGSEDAIGRFVDKLRNGPPRQARIDAIDVVQVPVRAERPGLFRIDSSDGWSSPQPTLPADLATCPECLVEIGNPTARRYRYPFTNCTQCGPRWSIVEGVPYDRARTSMKRFTMCPDCRREYENPTDRRFHAQPIACPRCGPSLRLLNSVGARLATQDEALLAAAAEITAGRIVALKGLGGFQLLCDATNPEAVIRLRQRKRRPDRPLAVMAASLDVARPWCDISKAEAEALESSQAPIVLLRRSGTRTEIAAAVAPGNPYLGIMLPYTPLHHLLIAAVQRPVVCTSGNLSEEPMAVATNDAIARLGPIADCLLTHDRPIVRPVDDSVARVLDGRLQLLRRARGYAPQPIPIAAGAPLPLLATGGHLKNTVGLAITPSLPGAHVVGYRTDAKQEVLTSSTSDASEPVVHPAVTPTHGRPANATGPLPSMPAIIGSHVGDLDSVPSLSAHRRATSDLVRFFDVRPAGVACDLHPDYASTREAELLAARWNVPLLRVQHHHAHVAACMAEHGLDGPVLGLSWDGTGYGPDGTVWGGEMLLCDRATFERVAHLRPFPLPGGDRAVREPRRSALGLLFEARGRAAAEAAALWFAEQELSFLFDALERKLNAPRTSSMGRLFDAIAALAGLPPSISFEGQAAMALEFAADPGEPSAYPLPLGDQSPAVADWQPTLDAVLADLRAGTPIGIVSGRFHNALAHLAVAAARRAGCHRVVLTGGCFQNRLLSLRARHRLEEAGFEVFTHCLVPPGDGGIALGQLFVATGLPARCLLGTPKQKPQSPNGIAG